MKYKFNLSYSPTVATVLPIRTTRVCFPLHNDDLAVSIDRADGEWYYTRQLEGNLVFVGGDYSWIMALPFDGTFTINIQQSTDGTTYYDYFSATFSRASLEIDEDNHRATLSGLKEGITDLVKNGAKEEYDLMKLIPDEYAKEVQGQVPPALALVDWIHSPIPSSNIFCGGAGIGGGTKEAGWGLWQGMASDSKWTFCGTYAEAKVTMRDQSSNANGVYTASPLPYHPQTTHGSWGDATVVGPGGNLRNENRYFLNVQLVLYPYYHPTGDPLHPSEDRIQVYANIDIYDNQGHEVAETTGSYLIADISEDEFTRYCTPTSAVFVGAPSSAYEKIEIYFHYIRATLLTQWGGNADNILNTGDYYKRMAAFDNSDGYEMTITSRTVEQPNGHRMVPNSDNYGGTPQYFAPPDDSDGWIALAEGNWNFASMWYKITPSIPNGLLDPAKFGSFRWTRCWTIGTCIQFLLQRITDGKVVFSESTDYSQFLYGNPNPVEGHEPFQWLVTQKSNVMRPSTDGASAARCPVKLEWFFELLHNAFNCYYWFEKVNGGTYNFRIEHVEYFRRGGTYTPNTQDDPPLDLTRLKPYRNFLRHNQPAKRYADQTNRYTFDLDNMVEKYTYSWQGDGGGDDFKGNPMYFKAGWIEKGSSDDRQVDNIFADLGWLMLNAGTDTASSKNYDGLFIFGGYNPYTAIEWTENSHPASQTLTIATSTIRPRRIEVYITLTVPEGQQITVYTLGSHVYSGTGKPMTITINNILSAGSFYIDFGTNYAQVTLHRIAFPTDYSNVYRVPNVDNKLRENTYLQNGCLAWPWLQCEYLHYDIPAAKWTYLKDEYTDNPDLVWETDGTIKMVKKQTLAVVPVPDASTEDAIMGIMGVKTGLGTGIIDNAKINLSSRNAEMTIIYDINPQNQ